MRSISEMLERFPPKWPTELSGERGEAWYFLLVGGKLIGGRDCVNHYEMLGLTEEEKFDPESCKRKFCRENDALRVCCSERHVYVEIFDRPPTESQWSAIGTLYNRDCGTKIVWDIWIEAKEEWSHGEGTLGQFRRSFERNFEGRTDYLV